MNLFNEIFNFIISKSIIEYGFALAIIIVFKILSPIIAYIFIKMFHLKEKNKQKIKQHAFYKPLKSLIVILGIYIALRTLQIPENISIYISKILRICIIILFAKGFANVFDTSSGSYEKIREKLKFTGNEALINFVSRIVKFLIYVIAGFIIVSEFGYDLNGLATGLGLSSVVIALAAQDLAKSIIAGFSILTDKPFEIGDYIETNNFAGTVEDITFRTTRIRDINNQVIVITNNQIADANIVNGSKREKRRYNLILTLDLATPLEKVSELTERMKLCLTTHENIERESVRVLFDTISENGLNISIHFYTDIVDYVEFLKFKEIINYTLLEIVKNNNIELAYNSQTIYLKKD